MDTNIQNIKDTDNSRKSEERDQKLESEESLDIDSDVPESQEDIPDVYPNAAVKVEKNQYSIFQVNRMKNKRGEIILNPEFQRNDVWHLKQKCELVESILMGIPIPIIYLFESKEGKKIVVDGRQRITALTEFLDNKFALGKLQILKDFNGKKFEDLEPKYQSMYEDYQLSCYIIQPPTPERVKYDIFDRVNRKGTQLNSQEMRNALYHGKATCLIDELSSSKEFLQATGGGISSMRMRDKYVILRALAFYIWRYCNEEVKEQNNGESIEYRSDMDDFLARTMIFLNTEATDKFILKCKDMFLRAMKNSYRIMGKDCFRFESETTSRRPISMPLFEILTVLFSKENIDFNAGIGEKVERFKKEECDHQPSFAGNVDSSSNVQERYRLVDRLTETILKND